MKTLREYDTRPPCALSRNAAATLISDGRSELSASARASAGDKRRPASTRKTISSVIIPKGLPLLPRRAAGQAVHAPASPPAQALKRPDPPAYRHRAQCPEGAARSGGC